MRAVRRCKGMVAFLGSSGVRYWWWNMTNVPAIFRINAAVNKKFNCTNESHKSDPILDILMQLNENLVKAVYRA